MPKTTKTSQKNTTTPVIKTTLRWPFQWLAGYWRRGWLPKIIISSLVLALVSLGSMYGIARWYIAQAASQPLTLGASFIPDYARSFGLDPHKTLQAMLGELGVKRLRLVGYWSTVEHTPGQYDFSELDWQMQMAEQAHAKVSLSLGLRQPRWPECHMPEWAKSEPASVWQPQLNRFIKAVIARYKDSPVLDSYQLENEYFFLGFGTCTDASRDRLVAEYNLVKQADPRHPVILSRSNNFVGLPLGKPRPDEYAMSVYKRVWDDTVTHRYIEYPFPAWYYAFYAGAGKILTGRDLFIHELQAEPWPPNGQRIIDTPIAEQNKSMDAPRLKSRIDYAKATGMRTIDMWGAEWWYWRKEKLHDPSLWYTARQAFDQNSPGDQPR